MESEPTTAYIDSTTWNALIDDIFDVNKPCEFYSITNFEHSMGLRYLGDGYYEILDHQAYMMARLRYGI